MAGGLSYPAAGVIARALWAAAAQFDERHILQCAARNVLYGQVRPTLQASWYVLAALDAAYPRLPMPMLAGWVGLTYGRDQTTFTVQLGHRRRARDWNEPLERLLFCMVAP